MSVVSKLHGQLNDHPDSNSDQAGASNLGHDLLQIGHIVGGSDQCSGTTKEGVGTRCVNNGVLLSLLDGGAREADVIAVLLDREGLSSQGSLINLQIDTHSAETRHDVIQKSRWYAVQRIQYPKKGCKVH